MALTGKLPFDGGSLADIMTRKIANDVASPRQLAPGLSEHVEWAVRRAMQADPERRFASCPDFMAALAGATTEKGGKPRLASRRQTNKAKRPAQERRTDLRFDCALPTLCVINLSVHDEETEFQTNWDAQVCNLSVGGIGLVLSRRFEPGSVLTIELTSRGGGAKQTRQMRVVRVLPADGKGWFVAGALTRKLTKEELRNLL
jgi:hypothetical protein